MTAVRLKTIRRAVTLAGVIFIGGYTMWVYWQDGQPLLKVLAVALLLPVGLLIRAGASQAFIVKLVELLAQKMTETKKNHDQ